MEPFYDSSDYEVRRQNDYERLEIRDPACSKCSETHPAALTGKNPDILCIEHQCMEQERSPVQKHHPSGHHNDPAFTVSIPANDHATLTDLQRDWPINTLRNPHGSPLRKAAAAVRGFLDVLRLIIDRIFGWVPDYLESLDNKLTIRIGPEWWNTLGYEGESTSC
ncbi:hypothetical protein LLG46_05805 [bacterium]|nr:hypothetical protein [bacterium]